MHIHICIYIHIYVCIDIDIDIDIVIDILSRSCPWNLDGLKVLLISLVILRNFGILIVVSFSFWYERQKCAGLAQSE